MILDVNFLRFYIFRIASGVGLPIFLFLFSISMTRGTRDVTPLTLIYLEIGYDMAFFHAFSQWCGFKDRFVSLTGCMVCVGQYIDHFYFFDCL